MSLQHEFEESGNWLFRWRSYVPILWSVILLVAMYQFRYPFQSHAADLAWELFCLGVSVFGLTMRILTVGFVSGRTSGRNTSGQIADYLNTTGMYSLVRHPLYFANFWIWMGVSLFPRVWWCPVMVAMAFILFYERVIFAEEQFLRGKFGAEFEAWASKTPATWLRLKNWKRPEMPFSIKSVLRRENSTLLGIITSFFVLETVGSFSAAGTPGPDLFWSVMLVIGVTTYLVLKVLKKSRRLNSPGR